MKICNIQFMKNQTDSPKLNYFLVETPLVTEYGHYIAPILTAKRIRIRTFIVHE